MRITLIGSGNVATHLGAAFKNAGHYMVQVYSRDLQNASLLAYHLRAEAINDLSEIDPQTDIFIIAVKDDAIETLASALAKYDKLLVHTSGATGLNVMLKYTANAGVFYPLQTFSKTREVNFNSVPLCIEGADEFVTKKLDELAHTISRNIYHINSIQRTQLHLAAVFACNFPNYLYYEAQQLLKQHGLSFDLLRPLILETAEKVQTHFPADVQTGPAIRNDEKTMDAHLQLLHNTPMLQDIYRLLSQEIIKMDDARNGDK